MWQDALAAHQAGRVRVTEARASDFVGAGARSMLSEVVLPRVRRGRRALAPVDFDLPHSLTYTGDAGALLAVLGTDERPGAGPGTCRPPPARTPGRPSPGTPSSPERPQPRLTRVPSLVVRLVGLANPEIRETVEMGYQFDRPFVLGLVLGRPGDVRPAPDRARRRPAHTRSELSSVPSPVEVHHGVSAQLLQPVERVDHPDRAALERITMDWV